MRRITEAGVLKFRRRHERLHRGRIRKALIKSFQRFWNAVDDIGMSDAFKLINTLADPEPVEKAISTTISEVARISARAVDRDLKADFDVWFDPLLQQYLIDTMFYKVVGIQDSSINIIGRFVQQYQSQITDLSINPQTLALQFMREWEGLSRMRAIRIARTEVASAANFGTLKAIENSEVVDTKTWNSVLQKNTRDMHREMHGTTIGKTEKFLMPNGDTMDHPLDFNGSAENVVNCQCYLTFD